MKNSILLFLALLSLTVSNAQEVLNNQSVLDLIELGFDENVIIAKIISSTTDFDTSLEKLKELKDKGVTSNVLTEMIKKDKSENKIEDVTYPKINDTKFYWKDGYENLVEVQFEVSNELKQISDKKISRVLAKSLTEAKYSLKNKLSFVPRKVYLFKSSKGEGVVSIIYLGKNSYGSELEEKHLSYFSIEEDDDFDWFKATSEINTIDIDNDTNKEVFSFKKMKIDGLNSPVKGKIIIGENYVSIRYDKIGKMETPPINMFVKKEYIGNNKWDFKITSQGVTSELSFDSEDYSYKTNGGVYTFNVIGNGISSKMIFPLIKVESKN